MSNEIVKIVDRIPFLKSSHLDRAYLVAFISPHEDNNLLEPTEDDILAARVLRNSIINRFATPREKYDMSQNPDFDACNGINGFLFQHDADKGWRYRNSTWENPLLFFPYFDSEYKFDTLRELINFNQRDTRWWDEHQELK